MTNVCKLWVIIFIISYNYTLYDWSHICKDWMESEINYKLKMNENKISAVTSLTDSSELSAQEETKVAFHCISKSEW